MKKPRILAMILCFCLLLTACGASAPMENGGAADRYDGEMEWVESPGETVAANGLTSDSLSLKGAQSHVHAGTVEPVVPHQTGHGGDQDTAGEDPHPGTSDFLLCQSQSRCHCPLCRPGSADRTAWHHYV